MPLGLDYNRTMLILAVLEKRAYMPFYTFDVYVTVMGGIKLTEPASDLAVALALASSYKNQSVAGDVCAFGEIGLTGEIRPVTQADKRVENAYKLGYKKVLLPARNCDNLKKYADKIEIVPIKHVYQAIKYLFPDN
jgi:DNA repair protein RadA/Sms